MAVQLKMSTNISHQTLYVPAFGRNFTLGALYDRRTEKIVPGNKQNSDSIAGSFITTSLYIFKISSLKCH